MSHPPVALTMATSLTFLPAMLGFLGPKVLSRRERAALAAHGPTSTDATGFWLRWARVVEARKGLVALASLAAVVVIALPIFGLRLGTSDASTDPPGSTSRLTRPVARASGACSRPLNSLTTARRSLARSSCST